MARPVKDISLHILQGTTQRTNLAESSVPGSLPRPPKFLSKEAKKKFRSYVRLLAERRAVTEGDGDLITILCSQWERWQQALMKIRDEGAVCTYERIGDGGTVVEVEKENLHVSIAQNCERQMVSILSRLGLTPKDRESVRPTSPVLPKNAPPHPDSAEGIAAEVNRLQALVDAERAAAANPAAPAESEPDLDSEELTKAMERV